MVTDSQIIKAIRELSQRGYPPTVREVGSRVGLRSSNTIYSRLARLRDQGWYTGSYPVSHPAGDRRGSVTWGEPFYYVT
ncbi:transcriptional regulator [Desulforamulus profundi]|uniref:Transcriptional regulator n=1 Tax=Desulforamulus profundi TaxID=1383067 RepID=A0A2C6MER1_9FIRM|nr:transcriptional regulator [Desulforamulus profundi]PHJ38628.1 transcriptional regulator [Desulforamulus profundi]